jgi:Tol biopolymer transport system component
VLAVGAQLGPYKILAPLGAGGMGEVYRAHDSRLGRDVAIKVLPPHLAAAPEVRARFEREARTISQLNHPHICTLYDVGHQEGTDYLVMELLEGETLARRLEKGPLPVAEVLSLGTQIADALDRAHRAGVVHRDLKPGNVMLTKSGAKLMDFGLARVAAPAAAAPAALTESPTVSRPLTKEGTIVGTFQYMAPEQLEGREADARSDLWALGCVLYEMATGKRAFEGDSQASLIGAIMEREPRPITELRPDPAAPGAPPPALERAVKRCLMKAPDDRWQSARDVMHELEWIRSSGSQLVAPVQVTPAPRRGSRLLLSLAALLCLAVGAVIGAAVRGRLAGSRPVSSSPVTFGQYPIFRARFEPDGQGIVFSAAPEGNRPELYSMRPEFMAPRSLGLRGVHLLAVSSRGELAVLTHARYLGHMLFSGTLARLRLGAEVPREILENVRDADWSPDGSGLAIIREVGGRDRLEYPVGKVLCESGGYLSDLRFSPRGDRIAFFDHPAKFDDRGSVKVVDLAGRATELSGGYSSLEGLAWSPDGKQVHFCGAGDGFDFPVFAVTLSGRRRVAHQSAGALRILDVSRRGRWLVAHDDDRSGIMVRPPDASGERDLSWLNYSVRPSLSGDGRTLLFSEEGGQNNPGGSVCLRRTDGTPVVRLGEGGGTRLSRDGKWALATILTPPMQLVLYPTGAGETVRLLRGDLEAYEDAAWLPDGRRILVCGVERGHGPRVYTQEIPGGTPRAITPEGTHLGPLSPDGRLVLASTSDGAWTLYPVEGGAPHPVPGLTGEDQVIRWSADGASLYVFDPREVPSRVERLSLASGRRDSVMELGTENRTGLVLIRWVSMADDPRVYAYSPRRILSGLFVVEGAR